MMNMTGMSAWPALEFVFVLMFISLLYYPHGFAALVEPEVPDDGGV